MRTALSCGLPAGASQCHSQDLSGISWSMWSRPDQPLDSCYVVGAMQVSLPDEWSAMPQHLLVDAGARLVQPQLDIVAYCLPWRGPV